MAENEEVSQKTPLTGRWEIMYEMLHFVNKTDSCLVLGFSKLEPTKCPNVKNAILPA